MTLYRLDVLPIAQSFNDVKVFKGESQITANLVIAFTKEFKFLILHVHENTIKVTSLSRTNLDCFAAPSKYLSCTNVCCRKHDKL